ncbi:MAG: ribonuclease P protein component [Chloroflexota bacterium]
MLSQRHRLRSKQDIERLFQASQPVHHSLCSLRAAQNDLLEARLAFATGKRLGGAVVRNRCRRRFREAARTLLPSIRPGWDILILVRPKGTGASVSEARNALRELLARRGLTQESLHA